MSAKQIQEEAKRKMEKTIEMMKEELKCIRTGRATPGIVENVRVDYYGTLTPLKQVANITAPEAQLVVISPYDPSIIKAIEKAILQADLGLTTHSDGKSIRIPLPPLSEDRRKKIVSQVKELERLQAELKSSTTLVNETLSHDVIDLQKQIKDQQMKVENLNVSSDITNLNSKIDKEAMYRKSNDSTVKSELGRETKMNGELVSILSTIVLSNSVER